MTIKLELPPVITDNQKTIVLSKWLQKLKLVIDDLQNTVAAVITDHGQLAGLNDNDHTQYAEIANSEDITGIWTYASGAIPLSKANATTDNGLTRKGYVDAQDILLSSSINLLSSTMTGIMVSGYVPYIGATKDINLGSNDLTLTGALNSGITTTSGRNYEVAIKTSLYNILNSDEVIICSSSVGFNVNLPTATGSGRRLIIKNRYTGIITVDGDSSDTIDNEITQSLNQWDSLTIIDDTINKWVII